MEVEHRPSSPPALADPDEDDAGSTNEPSLSGGWESMTLPADDAWENLLDRGEERVRVCDCMLPWNRCNKCNCYEAQTRRRLLSMLVKGRSRAARSSPPMTPAVWDLDTPTRRVDVDTSPLQPTVPLESTSKGQESASQQASPPPTPMQPQDAPTPPQDSDDRLDHCQPLPQQQQEQLQQQYQQHPKQSHQPLQQPPQYAASSTLQPSPQNLQQMQQFCSVAFSGPHQFLQTWPMWAQEMWRQWAAMNAAVQQMSFGAPAGTHQFPRQEQPAPLSPKSAAQPAPAAEKPSAVPDCLPNNPLRLGPVPFLASGPG